MTRYSAPSQPGPGFHPRALCAALVVALALPLGTATAEGAEPATAGSAPAPAPAQPPRNQTSPTPLQISERVTLGPAPTGADAAALVAQEGLFIDLRTDDDLKKHHYVPTLGLHRQRLPIADLADASATSDTLRDMLAAAGSRSVWIGCNSGNRAGLAWALLQIAEGAEPEAALAAVDPLVTYEPLRNAILNP